MDTFANLEAKLTSFEAARLSAINSTLSVSKGLPKGAIQGSVQSVVIEESRRGANNPLPVVVAVGVNYHQCPVARNWPPFTYYLGTTPSGAPQVAEPIPAMRKAADFALSAYHRNSAAWIAKVQALAGIPSMPSYHLIAMNLSPFITLKSWSELSLPDQMAIFSAWPWPPHLLAFSRVLGGTVDLWIWHGMTFVTPLFSGWLSAHLVPSWLLTYNLSSLGHGNMRRAQKNPSHPLHALYK